MKTTTIETLKGQLIGEEKANCVVYTSVPYARTERFEDPKEIANWTLFDATAKPKNCHQRFEYVDESQEQGFYYREFDYWRDSDYVEDVMTCTIITPKKPMESCPVICFVHGGSYENGHSEDCPFGDTDEYAKRGVIVVSIGYRLNVFGLYDSGNYGLKDIIFAVKWVKENIASFHGDPKRIILMGQSAGAMAVYNILLSNRLQGVISGAVMMSGLGILPPMIAPKTKEENHWFWYELMLRCGCQNEDELKKIDHAILWKNWYDLKAEKGNIAISLPAIDHDLLKQHPNQIVKNQQDQDVPLIVGVTSQDMFPLMIFDLALGVGKKRIQYNRCNVYGYFFDVEPPGNYYKAFHGCDLWYLFGNFQKSWRPFDQTDERISSMMIDYIVNFVKKGDPNGSSLPNWPALSKQNRMFRWFNKGQQVMISPGQARLKLWWSFFKDRGPF